VVSVTDLDWERVLDFDSGLAIRVIAVMVLGVGGVRRGYSPASCAGNAR
jgi:hypothetical protein